MALSGAILVADFLPFIAGALGTALIIIRAARPSLVSRMHVRRGLWALIAYHLAYPLLLTLLQWRVWSGNPLTKTMLDLPLDASVPVPSLLAFLFSVSGGYFAFYATRFWTEHILALLSTALIAGTAHLVRRGGEKTEGESLALLSLGTLVVGWPSLCIFLPLLLAAAFFVSRFRPLSTLALPVAIAVPLTFCAGMIPFVAFHLALLSP